MDIQEQLREIKGHYRRGMNGVVSTSMREKGVQYKVNFGLELPRIKAIAQLYPKDHRLAQALWKEPIRESKILATLLQPIENFIPEICDIWVEEITQQEIAEAAAFHLFCRLPYASEKAFAWMASEMPLTQVCGFLVMGHLFARNCTLNEQAMAEYLDQTVTSLQDENTAVARTAYHALLRFVELGATESQAALSHIQMAMALPNHRLNGYHDALKAAAEMAKPF